MWTDHYGWQRVLPYRLLNRLGWENYAANRQRVTEWVRPHPNDVRPYSTKRALWVAFTGRTRRGGWNASWRLWVAE